MQEIKETLFRIQAKIDLEADRQKQLLNELEERFNLHSLEEIEELIREMEKEMESLIKKKNQSLSKAKDILDELSIDS